MIILVAILVVAIVLAVAIPGITSERSHRRWRLRPRPTARGQADWWPEFERQFRAYVREHEREAH